ncbi:hypothetical protein C8Q79DRAFT_581594 [Trametes meyenii]|nr:hypothetical protein C8Q79DRAFT_581594 [Trametes meyenii]
MKAESTLAARYQTAEVGATDDMDNDGQTTNNEHVVTLASSGPQVAQHTFCAFRASWRAALHCTRGNGRRTVHTARGICSGRARDEQRCERGTRLASRAVSSGSVFQREQPILPRTARRSVGVAQQEAREAAAHAHERARVIMTVDGRIRRRLGHRWLGCADPEMLPASGVRGVSPVWTCGRSLLGAIRIFPPSSSWHRCGGVRGAGTRYAGVGGEAARCRCRHCSRFGTEPSMHTRRDVK